MKTIIESDYFKKIQDNNLLLTDHLGGFDKNLESDILNSVVQFSKENNISTIKSAYVFSDYFIVVKIPSSLAMKLTNTLRIT